MIKEKMTRSEAVIIKKLEKYEEKRRYPRIKVKCPVTLLLPEAQRLEASVYDVSPGGIQIRCTTKAAQILKALHQPEQDKRYQFGASMMLPLYEEHLKIVVRCRVAYILKLKKNYYAVGIQFLNVRGESKKLLKRFIECSMEPA